MSCLLPWLAAPGSGVSCELGLPVLLDLSTRLVRLHVEERDERGTLVMCMSEAHRVPGALLGA